MALAFLASGSEPDDKAPVPAVVVSGPPATAASQACARATEFEQLVARNGLRPQLESLLRDAVAAARSAAHRDVTYIRLQSGLEALEVALANDDPQAARVGIDVVRAECLALAVGTPASPGPS